MSVSYLDRQALSAIAPTVCKAFDLSHQQFGWLGSAFAFAYLACAPLSGRLVDRFGARILLALAVLLWSAVAASHAAATTFASLMVLRVLLGAAESPSFPAAAQTIRGVLPPSQRSAGFGLLFTGSSIGAMVAAPLAVRIARDHGFRFAFVAIAFVGLAWLPLWMWASPRTHTATERAPFLPVLLHPSTRRQAVIVATSAPAIAIVLNWYSQLLVETQHVSKDDVGHYLWLPPLVFDVSAITFGVVASMRDRKSPGASHWVLMFVAATLAATLALVPLAPGPWTAVLLGSTTLAGGAGMYVLCTADLMKRMPPASVATAGGLGAAVQSIMGIVMNPIVGATIDRTHVWAWVLIPLGAIAIPGAVAWSLLPPERATRPASQ